MNDARQELIARINEHFKRGNKPTSADYDTEVRKALVEAINMAASLRVVPREAELRWRAALNYAAPAAVARQEESEKVNYVAGGRTNPAAAQSDKPLGSDAVTKLGMDQYELGCKLPSIFWSMYQYGLADAAPAAVAREPQTGCIAAKDVPIAYAPPAAAEKGELQTEPCDVCDKNRDNAKRGIVGMVMCPVHHRGPPAADAERMDWLQRHWLAADFDYGERHECVLVFRWPKDARVGQSLRIAIDAALSARQRDTEEK